MRYEDYIDLNYEPDKNDLVCDYSVEPLNVSMEWACGAVAAESSIGTWEEVSTEKPYMRRLAAKVFEIEGGRMKVAYPFELFEAGNMPNIMSSIAGNIFGMKDLISIRFNDILLPDIILKSFMGPKFGIDGVRKILNVKNRPLVGTIIKPKLGLNIKDQAKVAYDAWVGGCDLVKDDENLSSQKFNSFEKRLIETFRMKKKAERETGEKKVYVINVSAETKEMLRRAKIVEKCGNEYVMVDIMTLGWAGLQTLRNENFDLVLHAHRAGHAAVTKNPKHGISMKVISKIARVIGMDQLHVGTGIGKMFETKEEVLENLEALKEKMFRFKPVMPVASGGLIPGDIPELLNFFGNDVVLQFGGGCHGHPLGTEGGAMAIRQALDASIQNIGLQEYSENHKELKMALEKWPNKIEVNLE